MSKTITTTTKIDSTNQSVGAPKVGVSKAWGQGTSKKALQRSKKRLALLAAELQGREAGIVKNLEQQFSKAWTNYNTPVKKVVQTTTTKIQPSSKQVVTKATPPVSRKLIDEEVKNEIERMITHDEFPDLSDQRLHCDASGVIMNYLSDWKAPERGYAAGLQPTAVVECKMSFSLSLKAGQYCSMAFVPQALYADSIVVYQTGTASYTNPIVQATGGTMGFVRSPYYGSPFYEGTGGHRVLRFQVEFYNTTRFSDRSGMSKWAWYPQLTTTQGSNPFNTNVKFTDNNLSMQKTVRIYEGSDTPRFNLPRNDDEIDLGWTGASSGVAGYWLPNADTTLTIVLTIADELLVSEAGAAYMPVRYPVKDPSAEVFVSRFFQNRPDTILTTREEHEAFQDLYFKPTLVYKTKNCYSNSLVMGSGYHSTYSSQASSALKTPILSRYDGYGHYLGGKPDYKGVGDDYEKMPNNDSTQQTTLFPDSKSDVKIFKDPVRQAQLDAALEEMRVHGASPTDIEFIRNYVLRKGIPAPKGIIVDSVKDANPFQLTSETDPTL